MQTLLSAILFSGALTAHADSNSFNYRRLQCEANLPSANYLISVYHDGGGATGGPSDGQGFVTFSSRNEGAPELLVQNVAMGLYPDATGALCSFRFDFYLKLNDRYSFAVKLNQCDPAPHTVSGQITLSMRTFRGVVNREEGLISCSRW